MKKRYQIEKVNSFDFMTKNKNIYRKEENTYGTIMGRSLYKRNRPVSLQL